MCHLISSLPSQFDGSSVNKVSQGLEKWEIEPRLHSVDCNLRQKDRFLIELHVTETLIAPVITSSVIRWAGLPQCPAVCFYLVVQTILVYNAG